MKREKRKITLYISGELLKSIPAPAIKTKRMMPRLDSDMSSIELDDIKKTLFKAAMKGEWDKVVDIYKEHSEIHNAKITKSGDTALHIAVSDGKDRIVKQLVGLMAVDALKTQNERGNTPLHLAAALGNIPMCECIARLDANLIGCRNKDSETPFFLAVLHGRKDAFLRLHDICLRNCGCTKERSCGCTEERSCGCTEERYSFCRRNDGETILHCAIFGEYFDLAFQIIHLYKKLVNSVNEQGISPLHVLAGKPSAFKSGSHIGRFHKIIYECIFVDNLVLDDINKPTPVSQELEYRESAKYPENYQICFNFAWVVKKAFFLLVLGCGKDNPSQPSDVEANRQRHHLLPANYITCFEGIKFLSKAMLVVFGIGSREIVKIQERKQKHVWSVQVLDELLQRTSLYEYEDNGRKPQHPLSLKDDGTRPYAFVDGGDATFLDSGTASPPKANSSDETSPNDRKGEDNSKNNASGVMMPTSEMVKRETPILIAAKHGVGEMVDKILQLFPVAIHDINSDQKNIVLLAVENRQPHVYQLLIDKKIFQDTIFRKVDKDGNSALHLAAKLGDYRPWLIPGAALQMQWEVKWYEYVKNSMQLHFFVRFNKEGKTSRTVFTETHKELVTSGGEWLTNTSESCSVVAALIATVAFATSATIPGGVKQDIGTPTLESQPAFDVFAISSLVALCSSVTAVVVFLAILTSRYQEKDFGTSLPKKLLLGLTSLFISIVSMLISFCAGHFFVLKDDLKYAAFPVYAITCLPVTFFAAAQFPLYFDLIWATFRKVPQRSYKVIPPS